MKRKALGKGLSALLPEPEPDAVPPPAPAEESGSRTVATSSLEPNPVQPRQFMDPARLDELAASIAESGIVQPILVRAVGARYQIIAGERRWRAAQKAGLSEVPVVIRDVPDDRLLELALIENIQRAELSPLEEAHAYQRLQDELDLTQEDLARKVGKDRSTVANTLRLLKLPAELRELLTAGRINAGHGRALLAVEETEPQIQLGRDAARHGLSVREVERRVALLRAKKPAGTDGDVERKDPNTRAAEERLRGALGTRVEIARRGKGGELRIRFASEAELSRIFDHLVRSR